MAEQESERTRGDWVALDPLVLPESTAALIAGAMHDSRAADLDLTDLQVLIAECERDVYAEHCQEAGWDPLAERDERRTDRTRSAAWAAAARIPEGATPFGGDRGCRAEAGL